MVHQLVAKYIWQQFAVELLKQKFQIDAKVENDVGMVPRLIAITDRPVSFSIFRTLVSHYIPEVSLWHESTHVLLANF